MKTNIAAAYVSSTSFTVAGDYSTTLTEGRKVRASCGVDGIKICVAVTAVYSAPNTTVTVSGDALTSNLTGFLFGVSDVEALPEHEHGYGDMFGANNLSELTDASEARDNLELGPAALLASGTGEGDLVELGAGGALPALPGGNLTGLLKQGPHTLWIPAKAMTPHETNGPELVVVEPGANQPHIVALAFDPATQEFAEFGVAFPKSWNEGTVTATFFWAHPAAVTDFGVVWGVAGSCLGNDDTFNADSWGTEKEAADTGGTTYDLYISPTTDAITIANAAENEYAALRVYRDPTDGSDTLAEDAYLIGVRLTYTLNAGDDS